MSEIKENPFDLKGKAPTAAQLKVIEDALPILDEFYERFSKSLNNIAEGLRALKDKTNV